jgi:transposase
MPARKGAQQATVARAHKIARIVYHLLKYGEVYEAERADAYDQKRQERELHQLRRRAATLGYTLAPFQEPLPAPNP